MKEKDLGVTMNANMTESLRSTLELQRLRVTKFVLMNLRNVTL